MPGREIQDFCGSQGPIAKVESGGAWMEKVRGGSEKLYMPARELGRGPNIDLGMRLLTSNGGKDKRQG